MIKWVQAVIDLPADQFDVGAAFWSRVTNSRLGDVHPDHDEFVHMVPVAGDMHLELQRIDHGPARVHLDIAVEDIAAATDRAVTCGATVIARPGHAVLETPGGVPFCIVPYSGESERAPVIDAQLPHAADQICVDIPHEHFEADLAFWHAFTEWELNPAKLGEFRSFAQPRGLPLRLLFQQLGTDDTGTGRAHLDISSGDHVEALTAVHLAAGATIVRRTEYWTALADPTGQHYCLTSRPPFAY